MSNGDRTLNEAETREHLSKELRELGYPESAIRYEFSVSVGKKRRYIDVAIIDPDTNNVIAIFEVKNSNINIEKQQVAHQLQSYSKLFPSSPLAFIYTYHDHKSHIGLLNEEDSIIEIIPNIPKFSTLLTGDRAQQKIENTKKSSRVADSFTTACYLLAFLVAAILVLDISNIYKFSSQQLTLLGIFIGLLVIPYAAKFKLLGMEFERYSETRKKNT